MYKFLSLALFLVASVALFLLVPRDKISRHFLFGLVAGPLLSIVLNYLMIHVFGFWRYGPLDLIYLAGIPVFQLLIWWPLEIGFAYYFQQSRTSLMYLSLILLLPAIGTLAHYVYLTMGLLTYRNWYLLSTFLLALLIHLALGASLYYGVREEDRLSE